ncbi:restriction endonuclease subunit S [Lactobacillus delbrueckii]|uniref:restriction endonuclease subunit S n=1 Tax=Lactobacillus delbrueckii TaxID=1584 RepID=UPI0021A75494|nr:restriction endonuclease subunit S [Lactobacillus delbrueckii]
MSALMQKMFADKSGYPAVRFNGFCDEWKKQKLGDIVETITDYVAAGSFASLRENVIYRSKPCYAQLIRTADLKSNFSKIAPVYVDKQAFDFLYRVSLDKESVILPNIGNCGEVYYVDPHELPYMRNVLRPNAILIRSSSLNNHFLSILFQSHNFQKSLKLIISPNGQTKFNKTELKRIKMVLPMDVNEQNSLSAFFKMINTAISLHEEKKHQLERLKSALLQKMFADKSGYPDIRFEGFSDEWEQCKLGDVAKINSGKDYKGLQPGKIPVYGTGGYMLSVNDKLSDIDAIGIGRKGTIDKPYYLNAPFWTVDTLFYVTPRGTVDISFMFPLFKNINWKRYDESTGVPSLSKNTIKKIRVSFPQNNEQVKIGDLFQKITQIITLHDQKLNLLKLVKQSLLQKMFI